MKSDIDRLMVERNLDALVVSGPDGTAGANPSFAYMTGGVQLTGHVIKLRGRKPYILHHVMERDAAAATGLEPIDVSRWNLRQLIADHQGNVLQATVAWWHKIAADLGLRGRVAFYGVAEQGQTWALLSALNHPPDFVVVGEYEHDLFSDARVTKDISEIATMERVAQATDEAVGVLLDFLQEQRVIDNQLVHADGHSVTIGDAKQLLKRELAARGLDDQGETIFAIGRDAAVPHNTGNPADPLRLGEAIVLDIFPRQVGGGYYTDMTRTFALGYASDELEALYDQVHKAYQMVVDALAVGKPCSQYQTMVCDYFESQGHVTIRTDQAAQSGYIHGLGHGVGLAIHEAPSLSDRAGNTDVLKPGMVITIEPGLYYPEKGLGVRIEDTFVIEQDGTFRPLNKTPRNLVLPVG